MTAADDGTDSSGLVRAWNRVFHAEGPLLSLALFRIAFACCLLAEVSVTQGHSRFAVEGGFHLPYVPFLPPVSESTFDLLHQAQYPLIALLGLGLLTRASCAGLFALQGYVYFSDSLNFRNHPYFFLLLLLVLMLSPCDEALSLKALWRAMLQKRPILSTVTEPRGPLTIQRLIQVQICLVYFYAGVHKCSAFFLGGGVLAKLLGDSVVFWRPYLDLVFSPAVADDLQAKILTPQVMMGPSIMTVVLELGLPIALWIPRVRAAAMVVGVFFHLGIGITMNIHTFTGAMIGSYLLFLDPNTIPGLVRRFLAGAPPAVPEKATRAERRRAKRR